MNDVRSVTIIGAGIVGLCCARTLQRRGRSVIIIDPDNEIIETDEKDNIKEVGNLNSDNPIIDVAAEVLSVWALPMGVYALTTSLLGVVYLVGRARRAEALGRVAEQSILLDDENNR